MAISPKTTSILLSIVIAAGLITGAFFLSSPEGASTVGAESSEELLRAYAAKDTDADGLHDWLEELYGADPTDPHSLDATLTDREAVDAGKVAPKFASDTSELVVDTEAILEALPGENATTNSLTDRFAKELFENYLTEKAAGTLSTEEDILAFLDRELTSATLESDSSSRFTQANITIAGATGPAALQTYGRATEKARPALAPGKSELLHFKEYIIAGDEGALKRMDAIANAYIFAAEAYIGIPVPREAAVGHLLLANALSHMHAAIAMMATIDTDPLAGMLGLQEYDAATDELLAAFDELEKVFAAAHVRLGVPYDLLESESVEP